ncbi:fibroblast growth factor-binding protein 2 [Pelobates fuscus]|uniref:fibroblast growth factor-binding protein 2 n=1 Tax=Pelobates fuscus TaxID=191477 RepID=UPI002FE4C21D
MKLGIVLLPVLVFYTGTLAQGPDAERQIPFQTKDRQACVMSTSGQREIRLKIECKSQGNTYSCEFAGKPSYCRAYNSNRDKYWNQLSQDLEKMSKPCDAQVIKHSLCPRAPTPSQFKPANPNQQSDTAKNQPTKKPFTKKTTKKSAPPKSKGPEKENPKAMKIAKDHCSWFFQKFCSYIIEIFIN